VVEKVVSKKPKSTPDMPDMPLPKPPQTKPPQTKPTETKPTERTEQLLGAAATTAQAVGTVQPRGTQQGNPV
jgi:hypothetical protein